jgi:hypothetical protein
MKTLQTLPILPNEIILEIASFGLHKEIRLLDKWFNNKIPKEHCIYKYTGNHKHLKNLLIKEKGFSKISSVGIKPFVYDLHNDSVRCTKFP